MSSFKDLEVFSLQLLIYGIFKWMNNLSKRDSNRNFKNGKTRFTTLLLKI